MMNEAKSQEYESFLIVRNKRKIRNYYAIVIMHDGASRAISAAMLRQDKYLDCFKFNNVDMNLNGINSNIRKKVCTPTYCTELDFQSFNQRQILLQNYTPPRTPKNIRYVSLSPISRMQYVKHGREPNLPSTQNYSTTAMPSIYQSYGYINTPAVSFNNHKRNMPIIYPSPHPSHITSKSLIKTSDIKTNGHSVVRYSDDYTNKHGFKAIRNQKQSAVNTEDHIHEPKNQMSQIRDYKDFEVRKEVQKEVDYSKNLTQDCKHETFSEVASNNNIIEIKKDLVKRVPDESDGILKKLRATEYIKMEDLVLEPATQRGTFGVVFKGKIKKGIWANKEVAVKRWKFDNESRITEEHFKSLEREIYAYRSLRHPNICSYIGVCLEPGFYAIITEYLPNGNLFELLYENRVVVSASDRLKISRQLCDAVYFIHRNSMIHRDIKTANIILDSMNNMKLCDFGQTRTMKVLKKSNSLGIILDENGGSPRYMAPECFFIGKSIDEKSDIWAIACCLLEIFGAPIPFFDYKSNEDVINAIVVEKQKPKIPQWFHPKITDILLRCFERRPSNRPSSYDILETLSGIRPEEIQKYGMNVKRDLSGAVVTFGRNQGCETKGNIHIGKRPTGNCIGVAQQRRIVVQAPTEPTTQGLTCGIPNEVLYVGGSAYPPEANARETLGTKRNSGNQDRIC